MKKRAKKKVLLGIVVAVALTIGVIVPMGGGGIIDPPSGSITILSSN
jgi:hypothetical protein